MLAAGDRQISNNMQRMATPRSPPTHQGNNHLRHHPNQTLHLKNVQPPRPGRINRISRLSAVVRHITVAITTTNPLIPTRTKSPPTITRAGSITGQQHRAHTGRHPGMIQNSGQLIHRVRPKRIAHLRAIKRHPHNRQIHLPIPRSVNTTVIGHVSQVLKPVNSAPHSGIKSVRHSGRKFAHDPTLKHNTPT